LGDAERHPASKKQGVSLLVVTIWLELWKSYSSIGHHSSPPSSSAPMKPIMETFCYRLTRTVLAICR